MASAGPAVSLSETLRGQLYAGLQLVRGRPVGKFIRKMQELEQLDPTAYDRLNEQQLKWILDYAKACVPFYQAGLWRNASSDCEAALNTWPVLEKETLRTQFDALLASPQPPKTSIHKTSGSTGEPARVAMTYDSDAWGWAHKYLGLLWHGIPIGVRSLRLSHDRRPFRDLLLGQKGVSSLESEELINEAIQFLYRQRPTLVAGPPSSLFYLARHLRESGKNTPIVPFARVGGEQLFEFQRRTIEDCLGARVINSYGCTETGALAGECPAGSMHVYADHVHLEVFAGDSPAKAGEFGDIVVTSLRNTAMPLIRYRVGDRGRLSPEKCRCGLPQPVLMDLQARSADRFAAADGSTRHGAELVERLGRLYADPMFDHARQVQFGQIDPRNWEALVEAPGMLHEAEHGQAVPNAFSDHLAGIIRQTFGPECRLKVRFVGRIPRERGKLRYYRALDLSG